jgi:hypothetical protein
MLILASDGNELYSSLERIKRSYIHNTNNLEVYFYKADPDILDDYKFSGDTIYVKTKETYPNLWKKLWLVLKAFENRLDEFDFICRPNVSTFIIMDRYLRYVEGLPKTRSCSGVIHYGGQPIPFPAGYLFTISCDIAKLMIHNTIIPDNEGIDDRCVGIILKHYNIPIINMKYIEINNISRQKDKLMKDILNEDICIVRIRHFIHSNTTKFGIDTVNRIEDDLSVHKELLDTFYLEPIKNS